MNEIKPILSLVSLSIAAIIFALKNDSAKIQLFLGRDKT
jgi:hypothetical protein